MPCTDTKWSQIVYCIFLRIYSVKVSLTVGGLLEVDIGITEGSAGDHVPAHSDGENRPGRAEFLVEHGLGYVLVEVSHIQGGHGITGRAGIHVG